MATLTEIHEILNYDNENNYQFEGRLFRDLKRDTATLYVIVKNLDTNFQTPELRIGFSNFENSENQIQTECLVKSSLKPVIGIQATIFVPAEDVITYQLDFVIDGKRHTVMWWPDKGKNLVASSESQPLEFKSLFATPTTIALKQFLTELD